MADFTQTIYQQLLPALQIESVSPVDPVVAHHVPEPWRLLGCGNYAAVLCHPDAPDKIVKVYAPDRPGIEQETEVYRRLGAHPAFSECDYEGENFLVLKRLHGVTLYDCMHLGLRIPSQVIRDIDRALDYARKQGLHPHDVHGRNVMMAEGHGLVVDVSDFLNQEECGAWEDLRRAYYWVYRPIFYPLGLKVPYAMLDLLRASYRRSKRLLRNGKRFVRQFGRRFA
jgi:hypothetical protein